MASQQNSIKHLRRANDSPSKTHSKNCRGRNASKLILWGHHHPDTKTRQRQHKKRKPQANITDEYRCQDPEQNFSKQNSATHQKSHTPWSTWVYSRDARLFNIHKSINVIHRMNKMKYKNGMIFSIYHKKPLTKSSTYLWLKLFKIWA